MDMNMGYWILEYGKVFCGYLFLMFLWPSVVFHRKWEKLCYTEFQEDRNKYRINGDKSKID